MDFLHLILKRQSVRKYINKTVKRELILKCIDAARLAPSASNSQPWHFIIVDEQPLLEQVAKATITQPIPVNKFTLTAPCIIVIVVEKPKAITKLASIIKERDFPWIDLGIAAEHICLQATELGLGTCMIGWFNEKKVKELLNIPKNKKVGLLITIGYYPDDYQIRPKIRKPLNEILTFNKYK